MPPDLDKIAKAIAKAPVYYDSRDEKETAIALNRQKSLLGFKLLVESAADVIDDSPVLLGRVFAPASTSARIVYEFGLDGSVACAAAALGYYSGAYGDGHGIENGGCGPISAEPGKVHEKIFSLINRSSSIGCNLFAIGSEELNLWPKEVAIKRLEEDLASLLLFIKLSLSPFGVILIVPTGEMGWMTQKISLKEVAVEAGLELVGRDRFGRIRLEWNPPVPEVLSTPMSKTLLRGGISECVDRLSFYQLLKDTLEKTPPKVMLMSSRLELARKLNSNILAKPSVQSEFFQ